MQNAKNFSHFAFSILNFPLLLGGWGGQQRPKIWFFWRLRVGGPLYLDI
jgi:hypothetical protein